MTSYQRIGVLTGVHRQFMILFMLSILILGACNLQVGPPTPIPTPDVPTVRFLFPNDGSTVIEGTDLTVEILGEDTTNGIARIELLVNDLLHQEGRPLQAISVPVFTVQLNWLARDIGLHSFTATAYRADGTASAPITIRIQVLQRE